MPKRNPAIRRRTSLPRQRSRPERRRVRREDLYGTWRLLSTSGRDAATGEKTEFFGRRPEGFLSYGRDGRMSAILAMDDRPGPRNPARATDRTRAKLFDTMAAYAGTFTIRGNTVTHHVDISWNGVWTGTDQVRYARIEGDRLVITSDALRRDTDGRMIVPELVWQKVAPRVRARTVRRRMGTDRRRRA